jgi:hypothetical protein
MFWNKRHHTYHIHRHYTEPVQFTSQTIIFP